MPSIFLFIAVHCLTADSGGRELAPVELRGVRREPVAALFWSDHLAFIACAKSGTLIAWDVPSGKIASEFPVGQQLRGVTRLGNDNLLVIDDKTHELIQLHWSGTSLTELARYAVPNAPASLCAFENDGAEQVAVASLWGRAVTIWTRVTAPEGLSFRPLVLTKTVELQSEPRLIIPCTYDVPGRPKPSTTLTVSDAFGGKLTHVNPRVGNTSPNSSYSHNMGGLAYIAQRGKVYFTSEQLAERLPITVERIGAGKIISSYLTEFDLELEGLRDRTLTIRTGPPRAKYFAIPDEFSGDPAGIAFTSRRLLVCLAGVNEVWVTNPAAAAGQRISVGKRPRFIVARGERALVLGELDDSVSLIDVRDPERPTVRTTLLDPATADRPLSPAERGERLFFDARQSAGGMMSCHSCHTDGHTNGLLADTLGDNTHGTPKRVLTLRGTRLTDLWAWNGEMKTLQDNVHKSLQDTMHAPKINPRDVDDLVSFLHTLPPVPPLKPVAKDDADRAQVARGEKVFAREGCAVCHVPPLTFTSHAAYDVGLEDEKGLKKFNPPSLRGVGRLRKLFHDNRANSLRDVFETHGHQLKEPLRDRDLADLVRYLESL